AGVVTPEPPLTTEGYAGVEPVYEELPGWRESTVGITDYAALPGNARRYLERLAALTGVPPEVISDGPGPGRTTVLRPPFRGWCAGRGGAAGGRRGARVDGAGSRRAGSQPVARVLRAGGQPRAPGGGCRAAGSRLLRVRHRAPADRSRAAGLRTLARRRPFLR